MAKIIRMASHLANEEEIVKKIGKAIGRKMVLDYEENETIELDMNEPGATVNKAGRVFNLQLCFAGIKTLDKITPYIVQLKQLEELKLNSNEIGDISSLSQLAGLKKLKSLDIGNNKIADLSPIAGLTTLAHLYANNNPFTDLTPLSGMDKLEELFLYGSNVTDLSPMKGMTSMEHLILDELGITDISALENLEKLNYLQLSNNLVSDISPLRNLKHIRTLLLDNNKLEDLPSWILDWDLDITLKITHTKDHICIGGNPFKNLPEEVIRKGNSAIKAHLRKQS